MYSKHVSSNLSKRHSLEQLRADLERFTRKYYEKVDRSMVVQSV